MDLKDHARFALEHQRGFTEQLLATFSTRDHWLFQTHPKANHAMWVVGHLGLADNMFASKFREEVADKPAGWDELFWFGSELQVGQSAYPAHEEVRAYFDDRRRTLLKVLEDLSDTELNAPGPPADARSPIAGAPCIGHLFLFAARHEGIHAGQLTVCHRGLGNDPLFTPQPQQQPVGT